MTSNRFLVWMSIALALAGWGAEAAHGSPKRKLLLRPDDPFVAFVPDRPQCLVADRRGRAWLLSVPEMTIFKEFRGEEGQIITRLQYSESGSRLAVRYKNHRLWVWDVETAEPRLTLDGVSRGFRFHPSGDRLVAFQPKVGITQWNLTDGAQIGPTIDAALTVFREALWLSADGAYVMTYGSCRAEGELHDFCIFDLAAGTPIAWADWEDRTRFYSLENRRVPSDFSRIAMAVGLLPEAKGESEENPLCRKLGEGRSLCQNSAVVALMEENSSDPFEKSLGGTPSGLLAATYFDGTPLWEIRGRKGMRFFNSCDISADGRWVLVGVDGVKVLLYDTSRIEPARQRFLGMKLSWPEPALVGSWETP